MHIFGDECYPKVALNVVMQITGQYVVCEVCMGPVHWSGYRKSNVNHLLVSQRRNLSIQTTAESLSSRGFPTPSVFALDPFEVPFLLCATVGHVKLLA